MTEQEYYDSIAKYEIEKQNEDEEELAKIDAMFASRRDANEDAKLAKYEEELAMIAGAEDSVTGCDRWMSEEVGWQNGMQGLEK